MKDIKYKILIVDDVEKNLTIVQNILNLAGYETTATTTGVEALELTNKEDFDLILLDIMMPQMSGIEVCQYLKKNPLTSSIPVIFLTANSDRDTLIKAYEVGGSDYLKKPFFKEELIARVSSRLKISYYERNLEIKIEEKTKAISDMQLQLMYVLGSVADGRSNKSYAHVKRVSEFTYLLAKHYGMKEQEAQLLKNSSSLHDIGKLDIPDYILHKNAPLDKKERFAMSRHTSLGAKILESYNLPIFNIAVIIAEQHHEKFDGKGYPDRLKGENIHIYARIVTIADVFDELSTKRIEQGSWTQEDILVYMKDMSGSYFDPQLIDILFENLDEFLNIYKIKVDKKELNEQIEENKKESFISWIFKKIKK